MRLVVERTLPCEPATAFSLVTDPRRMSAWSTARVESLAPGDGDHPAGVGALRRIHLPAPGPSHLDEIVVASEAPRRFVYRVVPDETVRVHEGRMTIEPAPEGAHLAWEIEATLARRVLEPVARRVLAREIARSLDRLEQIAPRTSALAPPPAREPEPPEALPALYEHAEACRDELRALAGSLHGAGNPLGWFARFAQLLAEARIDGCRTGRYAHPAWVVRLVPASLRYYIDNLRTWLEGRRAAVETHWLAAFVASEGAGRRHPGPGAAAARAISHGLDALVDEDAPRALAATWWRAQAARCDYVRLRADHVAMGEELGEAMRRLAPLLPRTARRRVTREVLAPPAERAARRRAAFERGARIAALLAETQLAPAQAAAAS